MGLKDIFVQLGLTRPGGAPSKFQATAPPVSLFPAFISKSPETIEMQTVLSMVSGKKTDVRFKLKSGAAILQSKEKTISLTGRKVITDGSKVEIFQLLPRANYYKGWTGYAAQPGVRSEREIFKVERKGQGLRHIELYLTFADVNTGSPHELTLRSRINKNCDIYVGREEGAPLIASVHGKKMGRKKIALDIAPGVDMALMVALLVCYNDVLKDRKTAKGAVLGGVGEAGSAAL